MNSTSRKRYSLAALLVCLLVAMTFSAPSAQAAPKPGAEFQIKIQDLSAGPSARPANRSDVSFEITIDGPDGERIVKRGSRVGGDDIVIKQSVTTEGYYSVRALCLTGCVYDFNCGRPGFPEICHSDLTAKLSVRNVAGRPERRDTCRIAKQAFTCDLNNFKF